MKSFTTLILCIILAGIPNIYSQVETSSFPKNRQLFARDIVSNIASIEIKGIVNALETPYDSIKVVTEKEGAFYNELVVPLSYEFGIADFNISIEIEAELANYKISLLGIYPGGQVLIKTAKDIVAGDSYMVQGQSNADAPSYSGSSAAYYSSFIRTYGYSYTSDYIKNWQITNGDGGSGVFGSIGQWAQVLAFQIVQEQGVPVAIFNGAEGGQPISYFQRNDAHPLDLATNYGRMLKRTTEAKLAESLRGILWYQGESNAFGTSTSDYISSFYNLKNDWQSDYPSIEHFHMFQIRYGCGQSEINTLKIQEAQRLLSEANEDIHIMSTNGSDHWLFDCHFGFTNGYEFFGQIIYPLIARDYYGAAELSNTTAPTINSAVLVSSTILKLTLENITDTYIWEAGSEDDFLLFGTDSEVIKGKFFGSELYLKLSSDASGITAISYAGHPGGGVSPFPKNANGIGLLSFHKLDVSSEMKIKAETSKTVEAYPNPFSNSFIISKLIDQDHFLGIYDINGKEVSTLCTFQFNEILTINGELLPGGIYTIFYLENDKIESFQIVKQSN